jgi:1,2-diacylglycerol 3-beta-galactosyltransferase
MIRILILMSNTGGGHRASAQALQAAFRVRHGQAFRVGIVDLWSEHTPWPLNRLPKSYKFLANDTPRLYKLVFEMSEKPELIAPIMDVVARFAERDIARAIHHYRPDLIISVHPLMQEVPLRVLQRMGRDVPVVTVITDLGTIHPTWFHPGVALCFVPTEAAYWQAVRQGLSPQQVRQHGLPIRLEFGGPPRPREHLRPALGLHADLPNVLLVGGGEGMGPVAKIAQALAAELAAGGAPAAQMTVICGHNARLRAKLCDRRWPVPTTIRGYVDNMWDWMAASDCVITKAGPGTIAEALACGLPIMLSGYLLGQEEGNVAYVLKHRVGAYADDPQRVAATVGRWFGAERDRLAEMAQRARAIGMADAALKIADDIATLAMDTADAARMPLEAASLGR